MLIAGDSVNGPATGTTEAILDHAYADVESDYTVNAVGEDLPVGLVNDITAQAAGTGDFRVMLRHLPELNGAPQKTADLPAVFAAGDPLPGDADVDLVFTVTVE